MQMVDTDALFNSPLHPYTEMLLDAAPGLKKDHYVPQSPAMPNAQSIAGRGCPLAGRCPRQVGALCAESRPPSQITQSGFIRCHIPLAELAHRTNGSASTRQIEESGLTSIFL